MAKVKITGHASGTGVVTVTAPNTSTDRTITLPDATATIATTTDVAARLPSITDGGNATAITIDSSERVGVGDTSPEAKLEVHAGSETGLHVQSSVAGEVTAQFKGAGTGNVTVMRALDSNGTALFDVKQNGRGLSQFTAKAWANCKQTGTQSIRDSHNCSSITDTEVGGSKLNFTNNMASATFVTLVSNQWGDVRAGVYNAYRGVDHTRWYCVTAGGQTQVDADTTDVMVFGD